MRRSLTFAAVLLGAAAFLIAANPVSLAQFSMMVQGPPASGGGSNVAFVAKGSIHATGSPTSPVSDTSLTVTSATHSVLVVYAAIGGGTPTPISSVTWNGTSMGSAITTVDDGNTSAHMAIFCLANPAAGANTLQVTFTGGAFAAAFIGVEYSGANQTTPCKNVPTPVTVTGSASVSITVTSAVGDLATALTANGFAGWGTITGTGVTAIYLNAANSLNTAAGYATGAATVTFTATPSSGTGALDAIGCDIAKG
jgi:hypothetical protein